MTQPMITKQDFENLARERVPLAEEMAVRVDRFAHGEVQVRAPFRDTYIRPGGTIAGPVMMMLADFAMYGVVMSLIGPVARPAACELPPCRSPACSRQRWSGLSSPLP